MWGWQWDWITVLQWGMGDVDIHGRICSKCQGCVYISVFWKVYGADSVLVRVSILLWCKGECDIVAQVKLLVDLQIEEWDVSGGNGRVQLGLSVQESVQEG